MFSLPQICDYCRQRLVGEYERAATQKHILKVRDVGDLHSVILSQSIRAPRVLCSLCLVP